MPQMAPLNWVTLFIMFSIYVMVFSSMNYFFYMKSPLKSIVNNKKTSHNWSW
uniref:ATP synthase complex subunit 8 n=1 Tax=Cryptocephalus sp. CRY01 TaxID=1205548 RepID=A0A0S2MQN2_9CUCU|nr:ATP synthase F0 subunit 8 [Cryptocephalus sp. CRY01]